MNYIELIEVAMRNSSRMELSSEASLKGECTALVSASGTIFTGVSIQTTTNNGCCAGMSAIAEALKSGESHFTKMVTVNHEGNVIAPSAQARELLYQINHANKKCEIMVTQDHLVILEQLLPYASI
ncbi:cytidine deaminase [Erysipelothrix tonsillarum]|uniref:cytidine deaminase n=1 Tax=Erysipelothrix tonsillarum TaxID=38402 RepID=UPI0003618F39|nr:cytidine deaminase [Erysipelothrix tonsillarum]